VGRELFTQKRPAMEKSLHDSQKPILEYRLSKKGEQPRQIQKEEQNMYSEHLPGEVCFLFLRRYHNGGVDLRTDPLIEAPEYHPSVTSENAEKLYQRPSLRLWIQTKSS
jgi:hypothetical protein